MPQFIILSLSLEAAPIFRFRMTTVLLTHFSLVLKDGKLFEKLTLGELIIVVFSERGSLNMWCLSLSRPIVAQLGIFF